MAQDDMALLVPMDEMQCAIEPEAAATIIAATDGHPDFLQEWGKQCSNADMRLTLVRSSQQIST